MDHLLHRSGFQGQRPLTARPLNEDFRSSYAAAVDRPLAARREMTTEYDHAATTVPSMQFAGLVMQLELERSKREDADRLLHDQCKIQFEELRDAVKHMQIEQATQREMIIELRRGQHSNGGQSQGFGVRASTAASISREMELAKVVERLDDVEATQHRHQKLLEDRSSRLESAVSEFCHAHISVEVERLRSIAREAARYSVDEMIKQRNDELTASWAGSLQEVQQHVMLVAQRSRDAVGAIRERIESVDAALRSSQTQIDLQRETLSGMSDTRALTASVATARADIDRLAGILRERGSEWHTAEAQLRVEVNALKETIAEHKATFGAGLARRVDGIVSSYATKAELLVAADRVTALLEPRVAENAEATTSLKQLVEAMRNALETRIKASEERLTRTQDAVTRASELAKAASNSHQDISELVHAAHQAINELNTRFDGVASSQQSAMVALAARLQADVTNTVSLRHSELNASLDVRLEGVETSTRTRLDQLEKMVRLAQKEINEATREVHESLALKSQEILDTTTRSIAKVDQRLADAPWRHTTDALQSDVESQFNTMKEEHAVKLADVRRSFESQLRAATQALEISLRSNVSATSTEEVSREASVTNAAVMRRLEEVESRTERLRRDAEEQVADAKRQLLHDIESCRADIKKVKKATEENAAAVQDVTTAATTSLENVNASQAALSKAHDAANARLTSYVDTRVETARAEIFARCVAQDALEARAASISASLTGRLEAALHESTRQSSEFDDRFALMEQRFKQLDAQIDQRMERREARRDAELNSQLEELRASVNAYVERSTPTPMQESSSSRLTLMDVTRHIDRARGELKHEIESWVTERFHDQGADVAEVVASLRSDIKRTLDDVKARPRASESAATVESTASGEALEGLQLDVDVMRKRMTELAHDVAVISREAASAAAEAASRAVERYREEMLALTASVSSQAASPSGNHPVAASMDGSPRGAASSMQRSESVGDNGGAASSTGSATNQVSMISRADFDTVREALHDLQTWREEMEGELDELRSLLRIADGRGADHADAIRTVDLRLSAIEDQVIETIEDVASSISNYVAANDTVLADGEDPVDDILALLDSKVTPLTLRSIMLALWRVTGAVGIKAASITETTDEAVTRLTGALHLHEDQMSILSAQLGLRMPWDDEQFTDEGSTHSAGA